MKDDDIEAIIEASKHFKYHEPSGSTPFNRISKLPDSKRHLKMAIKERIRLLVASYISLASFISDDDVDFLESADTKKRKRYRSAWIVDGKLTSNHWMNDVFLKVPLRELKGKIEFGKKKFTLTQGEQKLVLQKNQKEIERLRKSIEKYVL